MGTITQGVLAQLQDIHPSIQARYGPGTAFDHQVQSAVLKNVHHDAVLVPDAGDPFPSPEAKAVFERSFKQIEDSPASKIPAGFLLLQNELEGTAYPTAETIRVARKETDIPLPFEIWYPRAVQWAQGLTVMTLVLDSYT